MVLSAVQNSSKYDWTMHAQYKLRQYGLSEQRIKRVIRNPQRVEEGIVKNTVAVMQPVSISHKNGKKFWKNEIWAMYQKPNRKLSDKKKDHSRIDLKRIKIISAWRYPGISPKRNPIPAVILEEISTHI